MKISGIQNTVEKLSRNPLTRADIKNPLNSIAIQRISYLPSLSDGIIENGEIWIHTLISPKVRTNTQTTPYLKAFALC